MGGTVAAEGPKRTLLGAFFLLILVCVVDETVCHEISTILEKDAKPGPACRATLFPHGNIVLHREVKTTVREGERGERVVPVSHPAFAVKSSRFVSEYDFNVVEYVHSTGISLWSISTHPSEREMTFSVCFRTPVSESYGTPHVLEHSVLQGSLKYPVHSVFFEMRGRSLETYLNASTWPDRTCFPVASLNTKDLYNLAGVYMDSVFHPLAVHDPLILAQEGWRYELMPRNYARTDVDCAITPQECVLLYNGVVMSEMKGSWSDPEQAEYNYRLRELFPDMSTFTEFAGGLPSKISGLTFEHLKHFHETHYTPGNAWIIFYGPDDVKARLKFVDEFFKEHKSNSNTKQKSIKIGQQVAFRGKVH